MDPDITRLCSIPGNDDLTTNQVEYVLDVRERSVRRMIRKGNLEAKRYDAGGTGEHGRLRVSRQAVVNYLLRITTGDKTALLSAIAERCPQYLPKAQPPAAPLPANVVDINELRKARPKRPTPDPYADHPLLFA
jgi:hypothetical protein